MAKTKNTKSSTTTPVIGAAEIQSFKNEIFENYQTAQNWYLTKRNLYMQQHDILEKDIEDAANQWIQDMQQGLGQVLQAYMVSVIEKGIKRDDKGVWHAIPSDNQLASSYRIKLADLINAEVAKNPHKNKDGIRYIVGGSLWEEYVLKEHFTKLLSKNTFSQIHGYNLQSLIGSLHGTGGISSKAADFDTGQFNGAKQSASDLLACKRIYQKTNTNEAFVNDGKTSVAMELQSEINFKNHQALQYAVKKQVSANILQKFIQKHPDNLWAQYLTADAYGINVKLAGEKSFDRARMVTRSALKSAINSEFSNTKNKTWDTQYTGLFVAAYISRYLINLIGPWNIFMMTGSTIKWMHDFLKTHILFMNISVRAKTIKGEIQEKNSTRAASRGVTAYEAFPMIYNSDVKVYNVSSIAAFVNNNYFMGKGTSSKWWKDEQRFVSKDSNGDYSAYSKKTNKREIIDETDLEVRSVITIKKNKK